MGVLDKLSEKGSQGLSSLKKSVSGGSDSLNMYKQNDMQYDVKDSTFRDIYERGNEKQGSPKLFATVVPALAVSLVLFFALFLVPLVSSASNNAGFFGNFVQFYLIPPLGWVHSIIVGVIAWTLYAGVQVFATKYWESQHSDSSDELLKQYKDDSRIQQPEELSENFDIFPDVGAHSHHTDVTAVLGHYVFNNDGVKKVTMPLRADGSNTYVDEDGDPLNKNVLLYDDNDEVAMVTQPLIDEAFGEKLWDSAGIPRPETQGKNEAYFRDRVRRRYSPNKLLYNPDHKFGKPDVKKVNDWINQDWYMPDYEVQRPAGAYVVDTEPNNTMVLAMTRAGKGQSIIEPTIDCWLRSDNKSNIVCNDPKGELYLKFYYMARKRGYSVTAFNLMEPSRTNIYNPLGYAVEAARQGNNQKVEEYVKTIGDVFFPADKGDDPMWPKAANSAFQRSALGLIDYYMEEDREIRQKAQKAGWSMSQLNRALDESWGHVTLYNTYQMMTQLASKKSKDATFIHLDPDDPADEKDFLTLFFDATAKLPRNALRTSVANQDTSLRSMAKSEKTMASVYGISLTAIKFFADDVISRLTSGRPSQNFDIVGMSFPRRFEVKLDTQYAKDEGLRGQGYKWTVFKDDQFSEKLGKEFDFKNNVDASGWINYVTKGIFPEESVYLRLEVFEQSTGLPIHTWYFKFTKDYQRSLDNRTYVIDPVSQERVIKDGYLVELQLNPESKQMADGTTKTVYHPTKNSTVLKRHRVSLLEGQGNRAGSVGNVEEYNALLFEQIQVHYVEDATMVFFITPPHLMSYARIVLILINQMFNMQVDKSYLTLKSQKPYYTTKYMLDEIGNLQSDGSGIPMLQTKESIGLAQGQYFTLILQTLQQRATSWQMKSLSA